MSENSHRNTSYEPGRESEGAGKESVVSVKGHDATVEVTALFEKWSGETPVRVVALPGAGSDRRYFRVFPASKAIPTVIGCVGPDVTENVCFTQLAEIFRSHGAAVPRIYAMSEDLHVYLQQDLGDTSLFSRLEALTEEEMERCVESVWRNLIRIQQVPESEWEDSVMHSRFSRRQVLWDLNYFKYEYLRVSGIPYDEDALENDFESLADSLLGIPECFQGFMFRDCQSRNVMLLEDKPYLIDFQGGRFGPCLYDAVSFLCQARAPFNESFRERMVRHYAEMFFDVRFSRVATEQFPATTEQSSEENRREYLEQMLEAWPLLRVFRCLQVLGAYGLRGLVERRAHFVRSIPPALRQLGDLLSKRYLDPWPELRRVCEQLFTDTRFIKPTSAGKLTVYVFSFSYMKGYPVDYSGNGGGFMFDCRAMHNPGRYPEYKTLTGRDQPVIDFLEKRGEVQEFLKGVCLLVDPAVARYEQRGFESLQIGFGCTGGQHRSVYCAEHMAAHLRETFPGVRVVLEHREQGIKL